MQIFTLKCTAGPEWRWEVFPPARTAGKRRAVQGRGLRLPPSPRSTQQSLTAHDGCMRADPSLTSPTVLHPPRTSHLAHPAPHLSVSSTSPDDCCLAGRPRARRLLPSLFPALRPGWLDPLRHRVGTRQLRRSLPLPGPVHADGVRRGGGARRRLRGSCDVSGEAAGRAVLRLGRRM
ncbi:hypothetical protein B0H11DRAFT_2087542, partial [Mycena galericulata]